MRDRWDTETHVVDVSAPTNKIVMTQTGQATGDLNSQHRVTEHPAGFRIRERGALDGTVVHQYRCPVHGVFDAKVDRAHAPDSLPCPLWSWSVAGGDKEYATRADAEQVALEAGYTDPGTAHYETQICADDSPWAGSLCGQGWSSGECKS